MWKNRDSAFSRFLHFLHFSTLAKTFYRTCLFFIFDQAYYGLRNYECTHLASCCSWEVYGWAWPEFNSVITKKLIKGNFHFILNKSVFVRMFVSRPTKLTKQDSQNVFFIFIWMLVSRPAIRLQLSIQGQTYHECITHDSM